MQVPLGVPVNDPSKVCKLRKSLYGLKQASRKWYERLSKLLLCLGFVQAQGDHTLFTHSTPDSFLALLVYVDDIVLVGNSLSRIDHLKQILNSHFGIKNLGLLKKFLGIEVAHSSKGISLCQRQYCLRLLEDTGMFHCKPAQTPSDHHFRLHQDTGPFHDDAAGYRRLVGRLLYLTTTRPDIAFATQQLSQFMACPKACHYQVAIRVLRYLKGAPGRGLFFPRSSDLQLLGFSDADWGSCPDSRRSISGYCFFLGQSLICWRAKKQATVVKSSSEAEYRALASATCELQWLQYLLNDLHLQCSSFCSLL
uniref:Reverse transcriptase Ty1/copia-type domain-containing protein n=1 Tax=Cajanus cajan TaxID=3821 RepID=A0A151RVQ3_CAJCA|nr:hypothetical protein KK1_031769 [Cajanus cajan]